MAWDNVFGRDTTAFEAAWEKYWTTLPENPTVDQDIRARLMTMDSFIARAQTAKHHYKTFADFWTDAQAGTFYIPTDAAHWLPKEVATLAITTASADSPTANPAPPLDPKDVTLKWNGDHPVLTEQMPDGSSLISTFSEYDDRMKTTIQTKPAPVVKAVKATGATNAEH